MVTFIIKGNIIITNLFNNKKSKKMGLLTRLFGKKSKPMKVTTRKGNPDVLDVSTKDERMNWGMEKARLTLHYFEDCLKNPIPGQSYFSIKVKIEDQGMAEHIWLNDPSFDKDGNLFGIVGNLPRDVTNVQLGNKIGIQRNLISDWMIIENGRLIGGYTIRAMREGLTGDALLQFDKNLGGIQVDYGEDYFLPNFDTPEGALTALEEAYVAGDLEKALSCKDFDAEAKLMLQKLGKAGESPEIIAKTSEVLKLSFLKSIQEQGFPNFKGIKRAFPKREKKTTDHWVITEVCYYPTGESHLQKMNAFRTATGWKAGGPAR